MNDDVRDALVARLSDCERVVELGVGTRPDVARALATAGVDVTATDVRERETPASVRFVRDDVTDPDPSVYRGVDAIYSLRCPPDLQVPARDLARDVGARFLFTTLGGDPAVVECDRETLPAGTLFVVEPPGA